MLSLHVIHILAMITSIPNMLNSRRVLTRRALSVISRAMSCKRSAKVHLRVCGSEAVEPIVKLVGELLNLGHGLGEIDRGRLQGRVHHEIFGQDTVLVIGL